eukprot:CAMPEP_0168222550 /NCGR_PEP_ID=MMETSP0140_2-20121125/10719_1 /TAXON_ID=44445 /ORGANISM="Pseudo-nitzschia australis, Strain 10249 10 AB" /LENGTH=221 /DNA_ID=CAMNT_0008152137 /DNA_START=960 /DNA_END=1622 /DNA_ORIENTATION=+
MVVLVLAAGAAAAAGTATGRSCQQLARDSNIRSLGLLPSPAGAVAVAVAVAAAVADRFDPQAFGIDGHPGKIPRSEHRSERSESHHQFGLEGPGPSVVSNGFGNDLALAAEGQEVLVSVHVLDDPKQLQGMDVAQKPRFDPVGSSPGGRCNVGASASASTRTPARSSGTTTGTGTKAPGIVENDDRDSDEIAVGFDFEFDFAAFAFAFAFALALATATTRI